MPPVPPEETGQERIHQDWETHPSWILGMEGLSTYAHWVNAVVLPIAFQWIEEYKPDVYATVPVELKDDVGVVMAAAFKLVKELPAYKIGLERSAAYEAAMADGKWNPSRTNPVWTGIVRKARAETAKAFTEQSPVLGDTPMGNQDGTGLRAIKEECTFLPPLVPPVPPAESGNGTGQRDWEMHPSWIAAMEALNAYGYWVSSVVLPIAFQWIEEHKPDVYANVPQELRDDVGVAIAAAFRLVKELPAYKRGLEKSTAYEAAMTDGTWDSSRTNPVWTGIVKKVRSETKDAFVQQASVLGNTSEDNAFADLTAESAPEQEYLEVASV